MAEPSMCKRCGCRNPATGKPLGRSCPRLRRNGRSWSADHGRWHYQLELPADPDTGRRRLLRRGGFPTKDQAVDDRSHAKALLAAAGPDPAVRNEVAVLLLACRSTTPLPDVTTLRRRITGGVPLSGAPTLAEWLPAWLAGHRISESALRSYCAHVHNWLVPHLGQLRLDQLKVRHIKKMFAALDERNASIQAARVSTDPAVRASVRGQRTLSGCTYQRIRGTLRVALNHAIADEQITFNPARHVKLGDTARPKARIWNPERVAAWRATGHIPSKVMVWTPAQTGAFLDHTADDPLYPLYHLIAYRGLRRGEACGIRRHDLNLAGNQLTVANQIIQLGWQPVHKKPKSRAGDRVVALDDATVAVLKAHLDRQDEVARVTGLAWHHTGMLFTQPDGQPIHPSVATKRFRRLLTEAGLPPIRLHDLRHVAASLAHAAGADLKAISHQLGHSTIAITADTYTEVFADVDHTHAAATATAAIVPRKIRSKAS